jgi:AraC-like DNA-binding protein
VFNCGEKNKYEDLWSHHNYIVYVMKGRKIWHTANGSYDLKQGDCVFVRKGACIIEQFFDMEFCLFLFFVTDEFICEVLKGRTGSLNRAVDKYQPVINIESDKAIEIFFMSMMNLFNCSQEPDQPLLELKFRELILILMNNPSNSVLLSYFCSLLKQPQSIALQNVMEDNFCFNLKMEEFAKLCSRSLSAFKRDFMQLYKTSPGKWLMEKRLNYARHLLTVRGKSVSEAAFESGFQSGSHFSRAFRQRFGHSPSVVKQETLLS